MRWILGLLLLAASAEAGTSIWNPRPPDVLLVPVAAQCSDGSSPEIVRYINAVRSVAGQIWLGTCALVNPDETPFLRLRCQANAPGAQISAAPIVGKAGLRNKCDIRLDLR